MQVMDLVARQQQLISSLVAIEDPQERMALVVERVRKRPPLSAEERIEENRVQGCVSRVWLIGSTEDGVCRYRVDADSTLVRGLAALLCDLYSGATAEEVVAHPGGLLETVHLVDHLSPTRRYGLEQVERTIKGFAEKARSAAQ